jgi:hypothetical protein
MTSGTTETTDGDRIGTGLLTDHVARPSKNKDHKIPGGYTVRECSHTDGTRLLFGEAFPKRWREEDSDRFRIMLLACFTRRHFLLFFLLTRMQGVLWGGIACLSLFNRFAAASFWFIEYALLHFQYK